MPRIRRRMAAPRLGITLLGAAAMLITSSGIAEALYGPPPPPVPVPGGYLTVVTSQTIGPEGGTIGPVSGGNTQTTVVVPPGAFRTPLQVTITEPDISGIGNAGFCGYQGVAGIGVIIQNPANGSVNYDFFTHPLVVTVSSPGIKEGDIIVEWNGVKFVKVGVAEHDGAVTLKLTHAGYNFFAVLTPTGSPLGSCSTSGGAGGALGTAFGASSQAAVGQFGFSASFLAALFRTPFGAMLPGIGVLAARWAHALMIPVRSVAAWRR
jgi:hypothetical protein